MAPKGLRWSFTKPKKKSAEEGEVYRYSRTAIAAVICRGFGVGLLGFFWTEYLLEEIFCFLE